MPRSWSSTTGPRPRCKNAKYDEAKKEWTVEVVRDGKPVTLRPKQLVLATGQAGVPNMPDYPGMQDFKGKQRHSSQHPGGEDWTARNASSSARTAIRN